MPPWVKCPSCWEEFRNGRSGDRIGIANLHRSASLVAGAHLDHPQPSQCPPFQDGVCLQFGPEESELNGRSQQHFQFDAMRLDKSLFLPQRTVLQTCRVPWASAPAQRPSQIGGAIMRAKLSVWSSRSTRPDSGPTTQVLGRGEHRTLCRSCGAASTK